MTHPDRTPVAQDVFTYCTREKADTWHVVMAQNAQGMVARVKCKACGSEHNYRRQMAAAPKASTNRVIVRGASGNAKATASTLNSQTLSDTWFGGVKAWGDKTVRAFNAQESYGDNEVLQHTVFGKGVVQKRRGNKMDVLFKDGLKTLPCKP